MNVSSELHVRRRQALIDLADKAGAPSFLRLLDAAAAVIVSIQMAYPLGVPDASGVALTTTGYAQIVASADVASAALFDANGAWVADFSTGLTTDEPLPELPLPMLRLYAGAFIRLAGAHIECD